MNSREYAEQLVKGCGVHSIMSGVMQVNLVREVELLVLQLRKSEAEKGEMKAELVTLRQRVKDLESYEGNGDV